MADDPITLDFGDGESKAFVSIEDALSWFAKQKKYWQWVNETAGSRQPFRMIRDQLNRRLGEIDVRLRNSDPGAAQTLYQQHRVPVAGLPRANILDDLRESDPDLALYGLAFLMDFTHPNIQNKSDYVHGTFRVLLAQAGIEAGVKPERNALRSVRQQFEEEFAADRHRWAELDETIQSLVTHGREQNERQSAKFSEKLSEMESRLEQHEALYREKLALEAPVSYWNDQADTHRQAAMWLLLLSVVVGVIVLPALVELVGRLLGSSAKPELSTVIALLAVFSAGIWIDRIPVRLMLSRVHLNTDARERVAMMQAFLALIDAGHVEPADRQMVLQVIFRPTATGLVKEDTAPTSLPEIVSRVGLNK